MKSKLVLQTGQEFKGLSFGCDNQVIGEIFFNTSMVGYQDILSDPAYFGKIACMTYPLIGNYGLADEDYDFKNIFIIIVHIYIYMIMFLYHTNILMLYTIIHL
mgnify:CR=1 FL=1